MFTDKDEAVAEGIRRVVRSHPDREGWINEEAYRRFGYGALNAEGSIRQANARRRADERARHE
jgi:hypothetical protein